GHAWVRTSYNYWTHNETKLSELKSSKPMIIDNLQEWEVIPHKKNIDTPLGITAWFADGHVSFCKNPKIFESPPWPRLAGVSNGPGDNRTAFNDIIRLIEKYN
ncbi:MAG: hypothetical protein JW912_08420, partial [Sedimentisphaerales bacterium]|nr:hypothetical protein [Sedimentisphaerales bacterium]